MLIGESVYHSSNWKDFNLRDKKILVFVICQAQKLNALKAFSLFNFTLPTFTQVNTIKVKIYFWNKFTMNNF